MVVERVLPAETEIAGKQALDAAFAVHTALGPGLLESVYETCYEVELMSRGISFQKQLAMPIKYGGRLVENALRIDFLISGSVVVELKAVEQITAVHEAQLMTYLKLSGHHLGLLINFNTSHLRQGIKRRIL